MRSLEHIISASICTAMECRPTPTLTEDSSGSPWDSGAKASVQLQVGTQRGSCNLFCALDRGSGSLVFTLSLPDPPKLGLMPCPVSRAASSWFHELLPACMYPAIPHLLHPQESTPPNTQDCSVASILFL